LLTSIRRFAIDISSKYIAPPKTTPFALMFLPTEGLYAEVVRNVALFEELRDKYQVTVVGITTLSAFLSSLQMGFKTLAIEQRSQEVWDTLRAVKSEFIKFEGILEKAHKQLQTADKTLETIVGTRTRAINRVLRDIEELKLEELKELEGDQFLRLENTTNIQPPDTRALPEVQMPNEVHISDTGQISGIEIPDTRQTPEIKIPDTRQTIEIKIPDTRQTPEVKIPGTRQTPEVKIPDTRQTLEVKIPDTRQTPEVKIPDTRQTPEVKIPDTRQTPEVKISDTRQTPEVKISDTPTIQIPENQIPDTRQSSAIKIPDIQIPDIEMKEVEASQFISLRDIEGAL